MTQNTARFLVLVSMLLPTVKLGFEYEYSPLPFFFSALVLFFYYTRKNVMQRCELWVFGNVALSLGALLVYKSINAAKEVAFFCLVLLGVIYSKNRSRFGVVKDVALVLNIYFGVAILEIMIPGFSDFKSNILTRSAFHDSVRGLSSLSTEPSFFVLAIFSCWLIVCSKLNYGVLRSVDLLKMVACIFFTKSSMLLIMLPAMLIFASKKQRWLMVFGIAGYLMLSGFIFGDSRNARFVQLLENVISEDSDWSAKDESASSRMFYIFKDLVNASENWFLPTMHGSYELRFGNSESLVRIGSYEYQTWYNADLSGSLLGRFIVELGFLVPILVFGLWRKLNSIVGSKVRCVVLCVTIIAIAIQMISLMYSPIAFAFGVFIGSTYIIEEKNCAV